MTKRGKISIVVLLGISVIVACLFLPYGGSRQEEGVADYYLFPGQLLHFESPLVYKDFRDSRTYIFSGIQNDSASVYTPDFTSRNGVYEYGSYFPPPQPDDIIACNDSFSLYKLNEDLYREVFTISLDSITAELVGDTEEVDYISYRYCSGFYGVHLYSKYDWGNTLERLKDLSASREMPETIDTRRRIIYGHPLLYIPYPLERSTPYIFSDRILSTFDFDTRFCGKRNYYATMYRTELPVEQMCRVLCYDGNGVLAEVREEYNAVKYPLYLTKTILPSGCWDKTYKAYVKSPKSLLMKSRFIRKTEPDSVWAGIRELSDRIDTVPHDYDPAIFVNAYELIASQKRK